MLTNSPLGLASKQRLLMQSRIEAETLNERDLLCPHCGFRIETVYSDAAGHFRVKCPKCKGVFTLNLAYFRKIKSFQHNRRHIESRYYK